MPILVLHGDSFLVAEKLAQIRQKLGPEHLLESNTHKLTGNSVTLEHLRAVSSAMPFLAEYRLVVVEGLLGSFEARGPRRRSGGSSKTWLARWEGLANYAGEVPPTTQLVFVDELLRANNPLLKALAGNAEVQRFSVPRGEELARWIRDRAKSKGASISPGALRLPEPVRGTKLASAGNGVGEAVSLRWGRTDRRRPRKSDGGAGTGGEHLHRRGRHCSGEPFAGASAIAGSFGMMARRYPTFRR